MPRSLSFLNSCDDPTPWLPSGQDRHLMSEMLAMQLDAVGGPLRLVSRAVPTAGPGELLIEVATCGVCRTDLHILDGEVVARYPIVAGHAIVGKVAAVGTALPGSTSTTSSAARKNPVQG